MVREAVRAPIGPLEISVPHKGEPGGSPAGLISPDVGEQPPYQWADTGRAAEPARLCEHPLGTALQRQGHRRTPSDRSPAVQTWRWCRRVPADKRPWGVSLGLLANSTTGWGQPGQPRDLIRNRKGSVSRSQARPLADTEPGQPA